MPPRNIQIDKDGRVKNRDYRVRLSKSGQNGQPQEVLWVDVENGGPWTITFAAKTISYPHTFSLQGGNPFTGSDPFTVDNGASASSGPVKGTATVPGTYRYTVKNARGDVTDDPDIDIEG
jgi:hypothetical protein